MARSVTLLAGAAILAAALREAGYTVTELEIARAATQLEAVRHGEHVGSLDGFPSADGRTIKAETFLKNFFGQFANR